MNKKAWFALVMLIALAAAALLATGCGGGTSSSTSASATVAGPEPTIATTAGGATETTATDGTASGEPIKIGILAEETGQFAWYGSENINGAKLFAEETNAKGGVGGRPIELVIVNTESSPEKAIVGFKQLRDDDKVAAIIGVGLLNSAKAVAPLAKERGPLMYFTAGAYVPDGHYDFGATTSIQVMQMVAMKALKAKGVTKAALLVTNDASGQVTQGAFQKVAAALNMQITEVATMNATDVDVTAQLTKLTQSKPDALVAWLVGKPMAVVLKGAKTLGVTQPIVTVHGNISEEFLKIASGFALKELYIPATKDIVWDQLPDGDPQKITNEPFQKAYQEKFGKRPGLGSGATYDAISIVCRAIETAGVDTDAMIAAIEGTKDYQGVVGNYSFSATDHRGTGEDDAVMSRLENGTLMIAK